MTSRDLSTIDLTKKLFLLMERKRRYQFLILLILMILTSMFEVISIGAVIPFLGVLIAVIGGLCVVLGIPYLRDHLLPATIVYALILLV